MCAELYNANLESWRGTYRWWKEHHNPEVEKFPSDLNMSLYDRMKMFTDVRKDHPEWGNLSVNVGRGVLRRFDRTIRSFYKRCAEGKNPGFPRFKPYRRWRSIEIPNATPSMLQAPGTPQNRSDTWWRLSVKGVPRLRFRDKGHRLEKALGMGATVKELRVVRTPLLTELHMVLKHPPREMPSRPVTNPVGIDKGIADRLILSDGLHIAARKPDRKPIIRKQRTLSRSIEAHRQKEQQAGKKLPHSNTRKKKQEAFTKAWRRETEKARQADFRLAHYLVTTFDGIAIERSNVRAWMPAPYWAKKLFNQRLSSLNPILGHKAGKAGLPYVEVNPAHTTTDCSQCGHRKPMPPGVRKYECRACGMVMCRDCNASLNISVRAFGRTPGSGGTPPRCRRATQDAVTRPDSLQGETGNRTPQNSTTRDHGSVA